ncbi:MAG: succinylglutamate desuccinylase, partial [Alkalispirochaeta sp.]
MKTYQLTAVVFSIVGIVAGWQAALSFLDHREPEPIVPGPGVSEVRMLSEWFPRLEGTPGDTEVYVFAGDDTGGSMLVLGGNHPNEPASFLSATLLIENATVQAGTLYVIPRANASAFTHNDPQEGHPVSYGFTLPDGSRREFRYGSRATNPVHQWPDPEIYVHAASGQTLSGNETRNLNRSFPGRLDGTLTERIAFGIVSLIREEQIDLTVDLHEASPEYPVVNAIVAHERAMPVASGVVLGLELYDILISLEPSPKNLRGLTHRELGDATDTLAVLLESTNPSQGRLRSRTDEALVLTGIDPYYVKAQEMGRLFVPYDDSGHPIEERVGRHLAAISEFAFSYTMEYPDHPIELYDVP